MSVERMHHYRAAIITASDSSARGDRQDISGAALKEMLQSHGYRVVNYAILPDEEELLACEMMCLADDHLCDVIFTTGGTGLSPRDVTPEATLSIAERSVPGIAEAMRNRSMALTDRAMFSRGVSVIRGKTLIINLPGSPKAVKECLEAIIDELTHGIAILRGDTKDCAR